MIRTEIDSMPGEMDEVTRRLMQMEIEEAALKKETDDASKRRLEILQRELADLKEKQLGMTALGEGKVSDSGHPRPEETAGASPQGSSRCTGRIRS